jgi:hypothetical protein
MLAPEIKGLAPELFLVLPTPVYIYIYIYSSTVYRPINYNRTRVEAYRRAFLNSVATIKCIGLEDLEYLCS